MLTILSIVILIISVILHEVAHGYMADWLGDPTARLAGRLSLNPVKHIDPVGSILVPLILAVSSAGTFVFGWAKPVPYNPYNLKNRRTGELLVALAGPASNLLIALIFGILIRLGFLNEVLVYIVFINLTLAVFNLIPLPPLDGSKILFYFMPSGRTRMMLERYSYLFVFLVVFVIWQLIQPVIPWIFGVITGLR